MVIVLLALVAVVAAATMRGADDGEIPLHPPAMPQEMLEQSNPPPVEQNTHREQLEQDIFLHGYVGVHGERIAIFQGYPPNGILQYVTEFEVRDDIRDQLENGVPFTTTKELMQLLESYTS